MSAPAVLYSKEEIARRVADIGAEIGQIYAGQEVCVVGLMKSCLVFMADMMRAIPLEMSCYFLRAATATEGSGSVRTGTPAAPGLTTRRTPTTSTQNIPATKASGVSHRRTGPPSREPRAAPSPTESR